MEKDFGGVDYVGNQLLTFGNHAYNMYDKPNQYNMECLTYDLEMYNGFTKNEIEIFTIGLDILDKMNKYQIFDKDEKVYRKPAFKDFSIILMSKKTFKQYETYFSINTSTNITNINPNYKVNDYIINLKGEKYILIGIVNGAATSDDESGEKENTLEKKGGANFTWIFYILGGAGAVGGVFLIMKLRKRVRAA
jgi:hypothetical protein